MDAPTPSDQRCYLPTGDTCFVCGSKNPRGLHVRFFTYGDGECHVEFTPDKSMTGYEGVVHGGLIGTIFDEILGWSVSLVTGLFTVTGELTVRYLKPIPPGRLYHFRARVGENMRRYWTAEGEVRDAEGTVYARAQGKYFPLTAQQTQEVSAQLTYQPGDLRVFGALDT